jgi:hypothetical protein
MKSSMHILYSRQNEQKSFALMKKTTLYDED